MGSLSPEIKYISGILYFDKETKELVKISKIEEEE
jgi:hypothetical protein